jgi:hypothetical protein
MYPITSAIKYHLAHLDWHSCFLLWVPISLDRNWDLKPQPFPMQGKGWKYDRRNLGGVADKVALLHGNFVDFHTPIFTVPAPRFASATLPCATPTGAIAPHCNLDQCHPNSESAPNFMLVSTLSMSISWHRGNEAGDEAMHNSRDAFLHALMPKRIKLQRYWDCSPSQ